MSWVLFSLSVLINIFLTWYIIQLIKRLLVVQDELDDFLVSLEEYSNHIDIVYNLERFYGDDVLKNLLGHSKSFNKRISDLRSLYDLEYEPPLDEDEDKDEDEDIEND